MSFDRQTHLRSSDASRGAWECLLDDLEVLLGKQIELAQQGDICRVEALSARAGPLVKKIVQAGILDHGEFGNRRARLTRLYSHLCLSIAAAKAETAEELARIRKGKKTIGTYRSNI